MSRVEGIDIFIDAMVPHGSMLWVGPYQVHVNPRDFDVLRLLIDGELRTYAQRSTLYAWLRWDARRRALKGGPPPTIERLRDVARAVQS